MAYFAIQVVSGREFVVKKAIELAIFNQKRTDILEIIVPSQIVLDLKDSIAQKGKAKTVVAFNSYVFINIDCEEGLYNQMDGDLFRFLNCIPNVCNVLNQSIDKQEMEDMLSTWGDLDTTQLVEFKINHEEDSPQEKTSILMKAKDLIVKNKVINTFKAFVHSVARKKKTFSALHYEQKEGELVVCSPLRLVMEALDQTTISILEFMKAPHKLLDRLLKVCYAANYQS